MENRPNFNKNKRLIILNRENVRTLDRSCNCSRNAPLKLSTWAQTEFDDSTPGLLSLAQRGIENRVMNENEEPEPMVIVLSDANSICQSTSDGAQRTLNQSPSPSPGPSSSTNLEIDSNRKKVIISKVNVNNCPKNDKLSVELKITSSVFKTTTEKDINQSDFVEIIDNEGLAVHNDGITLSPVGDTVPKDILADNATVTKYAEQSNESKKYDDIPTHSNIINKQKRIEKSVLEENQNIDNLPKEENQLPAKIRKSLDDSLLDKAFPTSNDNETLDEDYNQENYDEYVTIGPNNTRIPLRVYDSFSCESATAVTRKLLTALFTRDTLATHTLMGRPSTKDYDRMPPIKMRLEPTIIRDIISFVIRRFGVPELDVRSFISRKCFDERKMLRQRLQNRKPNEENSNMYKRITDVYKKL